MKTGIVGAGISGLATGQAILARDPQAARRIRERLTVDPPNTQARFVDFKVSQTGLRITRS